ncbi:hypothetical protein ACH4U6_01480 [Streptomyces netropsis]|uniref:hypothetical protein n=1 Tax=Streptomyces netropsis TaxID=55404 RepID=UPI0037AB81BE
MGLLSWLSGRRHAVPPADGPASPSPATSGDGWRELPPLQRTLGDTALVTDPDGFRDSLGTWRNASFTTAPLGHEVSPQAPSGVGHGLATRAAGTPAFTSAPAPTVSRETVPSVAPVPSESAALPVPLQRVVDEPLVSARPWETFVHQLAPLPPATGPAPVPGPGPVPGAPASPPPPPPVQRSAAPHGLGLGAPLAALPPTAQRAPVASTGESPAAPPPVPGPTAPETAGPEAPKAPAAPAPAAPTRPLLGAPPLVARQSTADPEPTPPNGPEAPADRPPVPLQRATADGRPVEGITDPGPWARSPAPVTPTVPLVAQRSVPLFSDFSGFSGFPGFSGPLPTGPADPAPVPAAPAVVPVRWSGPAPATPPPPVQRTPSAPTPVVPWTAAPVPPSPGLPGAPVQRLTAAPATPSSRAEAEQPARMLDAGAVAVAAGVAQRMADGSVVFRASRSLPAVQREATASGPAPSETPPLGPGPPPEPPPPEPGPEPSPPDGGTDGQALGAPATTGLSDGKGTPQGTAPAVTDELVRALFAPLSRLLKAELRLERERAGFLIDTRH